MATVNVVRTARKRWRCDDCLGWIEPGEKYRKWTAFPHDPDLGNRHFYSISECAGCCARYLRPVS